MDMRCSVHLRTPPERQAYIDEMLAAIATYFEVSEGGMVRFLTHPKIREVKKILRSVTMQTRDIISYLGEGFMQEMRGGDGGER